MEERIRLLCRYFYYLFLLVVVFLFLWVVVLLFRQSVEDIGGLHRLVGNVAQWYDAVFFQYNLLLVSITVSVPPLITLFYILKMKEKKIIRLKSELPGSIVNDPKEWQQIVQSVHRSFEFGNFSGSVAVLTLFIMMGAMIILLLKPLPLDGQGFGVDYSKGANFLMSGPYMIDFIKGEQTVYIERLTYTLTAFQFGFLGAYVYFVTHLVRSYFTLDITPGMFVASTIRIVLGSVLPLVLSFCLIDSENFSNPGWLPLASFFIGFFPQRGLLIMEKTAIGVINSWTGKKTADKRTYNSTGLSELPGMSYQHEIRLNSEGYDNIENIVHADPVKLAVRTGFSYPQLKKWISQAALLEHLGKDYKEFATKTGLTGMDELKSYCDKCAQKTPPEDPSTLLSATLPSSHQVKMKVLCSLNG
ncbi:MAG: helix-hairpin-helix domain-containing protein [Gammaproteobacteria bacterium]